MDSPFELTHHPAASEDFRKSKAWHERLYWNSQSSAARGGHAHPRPAAHSRRAGTGKTRVITARIAHMVNEGILPKHILAVTFTNKAANEMRERVKGMVRDGLGKKIGVGTFHAFCATPAARVRGAAWATRTTSSSTASRSRRA
jgi:hypothetical protein